MPRGGGSRSPTDTTPIGRPSHNIYPRARHVLDRFHVVRWFTEGLTLVRRELQRRDPDRRPPTYEPDLFRARYTLLRRADNLSEAHKQHLDRLFAAHPRLKVAWDALQDPLPDLRSRRPRSRQPGASPLRGPLRQRTDPRIPRRGGQDHLLGRRDTRLPHQPTSHQRATRGHQQPTPGPTTRSPRVHQLRQLRRRGLLVT